MDDKELADRIVAILGDAHVAEWQQPVVIQNNGAWMGVVRYVRDWRVAGAMMEKLDDGLVYYKGDENFAQGGKWCVATVDMTVTHLLGMDESLPRAINKACCESLS